MLGETTKTLVGQALGLVAAPAAFVGSALRHGRLFHPRGEVCTGTVTADPEAKLSELGTRLQGEAIVRFSAGLHKSEVQRFEVLGCALRLHGSRNDQDLIFGTMKHLWSLPLAPLMTEGHDYFANHYYTVTSYKVARIGIVTLRLAPLTDGVAAGTTREDRLATRIAARTAAFAIEARRDGEDAWTRVATLDVQARREGPQDDLAFSPENNGRGLEPIGVINALRGVAYRASQAGRRWARITPRRSETHDA